MSTSPLVSVIIPTYNRAQLLVETLESVKGQTYQNWECIVVDDGSTDGTEAVVQKFILSDNRFQYHHRPKSRLPGGNAARNYGLEISKGEFINWLDSDDLFAPSKLEEQVAAIEKKSVAVHICQGQIFSSAENGEKVWDVLWPEKFPEENANMLRAMFISDLRWPTGAALWRREAATNVTWDENLKGAQEWSFHLFQSLSLENAQFGFLEKVLIYIRKTEISITQNPEQVSRFEAYLEARIKVLEFIKRENIEDWQIYFKSTYRFSLRYVKVLVLAGDSPNVEALGDLIREISFYKYLKYKFGLLVYKYAHKDYFLKKLM